MPYQRPRAVAVLTVGYIGKPSERKAQNESDQVFSFPIRCRKVNFRRNDINHADEAYIEGEYKDLGLDPRVLRNATVHLYIGQADDNDDFSPQDNSNLVFIGIATRVSRTGSEDSGLQLSIHFQDYTTLFLNQKGLSLKFHPKPDQTLSQAWASICDGVGPTDKAGNVKSTVSVLRDHLVFGEGVGDLVIGKALPERIRKFGRFVPKSPNSDVWSIWRSVCDSLGLITYIDRDNCMVQLPRNFYNPKSSPKLIWGKNIESINEEHTARKYEGVAVRSFDPLTNTTLESLFPVPEDLISSRKGKTPITLTKKSKRSGGTPGTQTYFLIDYPGVSDQARLDEVAERIYRELSSQDLEGTVVTQDIKIEDINNNTFNLLSLAAGDTVTITFDPENKTLLKSLGSKGQQLAYLLSQGYHLNFAEFLVNNLQDIDKWKSEFLVKGVACDLETDENEGSFKIEINYCSRVDLDGNTIGTGSNS